MIKMSRSADLEVKPMVYEDLLFMKARSANKIRSLRKEHRPRQVKKVKVERRAIPVKGLENDSLRQQPLCG
jgi:hypothetical protein